MKIYTRKGDTGDTGLGDGTRVRKDEPRVAAYGDVDELNSVIGVVRASSAEPAVARPDGVFDALLAQVQRDLFALGAQLADPRAGGRHSSHKAALTDEHVRRLEAAIDAHEAVLPPLRAFILPGGSRLGAHLHLARTTCRRAERAAVALAQVADVDPQALVYLNRLSDLLFVLARAANHAAGNPEEAW